MGMLARKGFPLGWTPNADPVDAPPGALLRADNMVMDELSILSLRRGTTPVADVGLPVNALHTQSLGGSRFRMVAAGDRVFANGSDLGVSTGDGPEDVSFGTHMGQIFFARRTSKWKYDGSDVRKWGIDMTGGPPTAVVTEEAEGDPANHYSKVVSTFDTDEVWTWRQAGVPTSTFGPGHDADSGTAWILLQGSNGLGNWFGWMSRDLGTDVDMTAPDANGNSSDDGTVVSIWVYIPVVENVNTITLEFSSGLHLADYFQATWERSAFVAGWNKLTRVRGEFSVVGGPAWDRIRSIHVNTYGPDGSPAEVHFDDLQMNGSAALAEETAYTWVYQYVRDDGSYVTKTVPSPESEELNVRGRAVVTVSIPEDLDRDPQATQVWLFRRGGGLDQYYRTKVVALTPGDTNGIDIVDDLSDEDAINAGITVEGGGFGPPDNIIDIEGPYYERLFVLTPTHLYPSVKLSPEAYDPGQVIRIAGADETCLWVKKAFNGLYIGTTKDIYRLDGTGAELPDGTVEFTLTPLNIDAPPQIVPVSQDGNLLVYFAHDGWRAFTGAGSQSITRTTSKLYHGQVRHGVLPVQKTRRIRCAICRSELTAITPEGATGDAVYRYAFELQRWYRFRYSPEFTAIFAEPDGTLITGDSAGVIREMDSGTDDDGNPEIPVEIWTSRDDDGQPYAPKVAVGFSINADAGVYEYVVELFSNDDGLHLQTVGSDSFTLQPIAFDISRTRAWRQIQLRITGTFRTFRFSGFLIPYLALPIGLKAWDSGPMDLGQQDIVWARRVQIKVHAGADLRVTPYFDDVEFPHTFIRVVPHATSIYEVPIPRAYFGRVPRLVITSPEDFHPYWVEFQHRKTTAASEKPNTRIPSGMGGEAQA